MNFIRLACILLPLSGCATQLPTEVRIPIPVSCIDQKLPKPEWSTDAQLKALDDYKLALKLWEEHITRGIYEMQLEAMVAGCG